MNNKRNETQGYIDMTYDEFADEMRNAVERLMEGFAQVSIGMVEKINCPKRKALTILSPGENISPAMVLDTWYEEFRNGAGIDDLASKLIALYKKNRCSGRYDLSFFTEYGQAENHIVCRLVNYERNRALLGHIPHTRFLDLAVVYYYELNGCSFGRAYILVQDKHLELWGIGKEQLHETAIKNTQKAHPHRLATLPQLLDEMAVLEELGLDGNMCSGGKPSMYVLTNEDLYFGAVNICFPDLLRVIRRQVGDDFYVLPSSLHECLVLPDSLWKGTDAVEFQETVKDVNGTFVAEEDVLSDSVYHYCLEKQELEIVA